MSSPASSSSASSKFPHLVHASFGRSSVASKMKPGTTFFQTLLNVVNAISGYGLLAMPYALAQGGWLSLGPLLLIAAICTYTALLLQRCMDSNPMVKTYPDIVQLAFGSRGRTLTALLTNSEIYLVVIGLLLIEGENLAGLFPGVELHVGRVRVQGKQCFVLLFALVVLPTTWPKNLGLLSYLSMGSFFVALLLLLLVFSIGACQGFGFSQKGELVIWGDLPTALSFFVFSFGGHPVLPIIYSSMSNTAKFTRVLVYAFAITTLQYGLMAGIGYSMFGKETKSIVTLNLPRQLLASKVAIWMVITIPLVKYPLIIMPVVDSLEHRFKINKKLPSIAFRTTLVLITAVIAILLPFFAYIMAFTGSMVSSMVAIILPSLCYLKIFRPSLKSEAETVIVIGVLSIGVLIAVLGTCVSILHVLHVTA